MAFIDSLSSFAGTVWFHCRRMTLKFRAGRYRRMAMSDEIRIGDDVVIKRERRDLDFEKKVAEFNARYKRRASQGAVPVSLSLHPNRLTDAVVHQRPLSCLFVFFRFKDTLTIQKGTRKVVVDRSDGLAVYGNLKAELLEGTVDDFYRQTVLSVELPAAQSQKTERKERADDKPEKTSEDKNADGPVDAGNGRIVLDPAAIDREREMFSDNIDKVEKAINTGVESETVVLEPYEREIVDLIASRHGSPVSRYDLQSLLNPYRKRVPLVVNSINEKCYGILREPLITQNETGLYLIDMSKYKMIF